MKYGLLYYKDTDNVGDDIQSYAASRFLPKIDYMIDRENLEMFVPEKKEMVATIMNAWYVHDKFNFYISPYIYPLWISVFFKYFEKQGGVEIGSDYLNKSVIKSLKKYGPVGCRDKHTNNLLNKLGIESYFSGCMTLTLEPFDNIEKEDYIVVNGLSTEEIEYIKGKTNRKIVEFKQDVKKGSFAKETWEERKKRVEDTLKLYQKAHMVITTKLHCSLPCLSMKTPVLLLYDTSKKENKDRIGSFLPYLNYINRNELKNKEIDFENPKKNKEKYLELKKNLVKKCEDFIKKSEKYTLKELPDIKEYIANKEEERNMRGIIIKHLDELQKKNLSDRCEYLEKEYKELEKNYNMVVNSRGWKALEKMRKILKK